MKLWGCYDCAGKSPFRVTIDAIIYLIKRMEDNMGDFTDDLLGKVKSEMGPIQQIASKIPGFSGYLERTKRRDADKLLRETLADRFRELEGRISGLQREFVQEGELSFVDNLEASAIKLRTFADRVKTAARGYAGIFDAIKVNEDELAKMYEYDLAMLDLVDQVNRAIDHVAESVGTDGLKAAIRNLEAKSAECIQIFNRREEVILGGGSETSGD
jgi:hypothetical protein